MVDRKKVIVDKERQTFHFTVASKPDLVNVDADKALLCTKRDNKPRSHYIYQYYHAPLYLDRYEAISKMGDDVKPGSDEEHMLLDALNDKFWNIRNAALKKADPLAEAKVPGLREKLEKLVYDDEKSFVRATALRILSKHYNDLLTQSLLVSSLKDSSYLVVETAFKQLIENNKPLAIQIASQLESESNADVLEEVAKLYADEDNPKYDSFFKRSVTDFKSRESKEVIEEYGKYLSRQSNDLRASGILFLDSLGRNARVPRLRLAAVKSLTDLQNNWNKYTSKTPSTQAIASPYTEDSLKKLIEEIKKAEKDDTLIKRYKQN
jgi:aminopeptidase N